MPPRRKVAPRAREALQGAIDRLLEKPASREFHRIYYRGSQYDWWIHWMGVRIQKLPLDLVVMQEILFETKPDVLVETGVSFGGSTLYWANLFDLMGHGEVIGIDVDLSKADARVFDHPRITLHEGSSVDPDMLAKVAPAVQGNRVSVFLDSDHSAGHVLRELEAFAPLVSEGCYLVVEDTNVGGHPVVHDFGEGPMEALDQWLPEHPEFVRDDSRERLLFTFNPKGYLRRR